MTVGSAPALDEALVERLTDEVAEALVEARTAPGGEALSGADEEAYGVSLINDALERHATECLARGLAVPTGAEEGRLARAVHSLQFGLGRLERLLEDDSVVNINMNGWDEVWLERADGSKVPAPPVASSDDALIELLQRLGRRFGVSERRFDEDCPKLNVRLPDGSRLFAVGWVARRPHVCIRRARILTATLSDLVGYGAIDQALESLLGAAVRAHMNILVSGPQEAGKTTLLRALASCFGPSERVVTIETDHELALDQLAGRHHDVAALEARQPNVEGTGEVTCAELVRMAMRMSTRRLVVGEVLGPEVVPMLNAMHSGATGSLCTVHANSSEEVFNKLALLAMQAPERLTYEVSARLVAGSVSLVVHLEPFGERKGGFVASVREVTGLDSDRGVEVATNQLFRPGPDGRAVPDEDMSHGMLRRLEAAGFDATLLERREGWWS